jgi:hypothetical protein
MNKALPVILVLLLAATSQAFTLSVPERTTNVPTLGSRDIIVSMASDVKETVTVNLIDSQVWASLNQYIVNFEGGGQQKQVVVSVSPFRDTNLGLYRLTLMAESLQTKQKITKPIDISVYKGEVVDIEQIIVSGDPEPTGRLSVNVTVKNYMTVPSSTITLNGFVNSPSGKKIFEFRDVIDNINPDEKVSRINNFVLEKYAEAGAYSAFVTMNAGKDTSDVTKVFDVAAKSMVTDSSERTSTMFGFSKTITLTNVGNINANNVAIDEDISQIEGIFYSGDLPTNIHGDKYTWIVETIAPGQIVTVKYKIDYTSLFMFIVALIVIAWVIFFKLRTVRVKKYIIQKKELEEGEEFTVGIEVKNASGRKIDEITVTDLCHLYLI